MALAYTLRAAIIHDPAIPADNTKNTTMWPKILIVLILLMILYNLGAGLFYMMADKGKTKRTVNALTWRIGLSVALILLVILGIWTGVIKPHGIM